ncbi:MAG TPA: hypothetical protein VFT95_03725, partial [Micromonosporaceae bacterium]|nr:hypothetical protein [Micromonosporaceae bacterium]
MPVHAVLRKSALRKAARKVAAAMPLGIGRHVRAHGALKAEVRRLGRQVAAYDDAYRGMLAEVLGRAPEDLDPADAGAPGPKRAAAHRAKARDLRDL